MEKISINKLTSLLEAATKKFVSEEEAQYFAKLQVDTHLKKYPRTNPIEEAINDIKDWKEQKDKKIRKTIDKPSLSMFDCGGLAPSLKIKMIHDELINKAKISGIAAVGIVNSKGLHTLNLWSDHLGKRGVVALCMSNGGPAAIVPYGALGGKDQAIFGTNPISYSIPTKGEPMSTDMASSEIPFFDIVDAKKGSSKLQPNSVINAKGETTDNVDDTILEGEVANIAPLGGGLKGSALINFFEILTSSLVRSPNSIEMNQEKFIAQEHGNLILAFDVNSFTDKEKFKESNTKLAQKISNLKPKSGVKKVYYPGQRSEIKRDTLLGQGEIEIEKKLLEELESLQ